MKRYLFYQTGILAVGTVFAWGNFLLEFAKWLNQEKVIGCTGAQIVNPFLTACFYGAVFFLIAFALNIVVIRKMQKSRSSQ